MKKLTLLLSTLLLILSCSGQTALNINRGKLITPLNANGLEITNLAAPTAGSSAVNKTYVDSRFATVASVTNAGTMAYSNASVFVPFITNLVRNTTVASVTNAGTVAYSNASVFVPFITNLVNAVITASNGNWIASANGRGTNTTHLSETNVGNSYYVAVPPPSGTIITASGAAGNISGDVVYRVTFVNAQGETIPGAESVSVEFSSQQVLVSSIPTSSDMSVTARKLYRYVPSTGYFRLVTTIGNNTATTYTDNIAEGSLGAIAPFYNTTAGTISVGNYLQPTWRSNSTSSYIDWLDVDGNAIATYRNSRILYLGNPLTMNAVSLQTESPDTSTQALPPRITFQLSEKYGYRWYSTNAVVENVGSGSSGSRPEYLWLQHDGKGNEWFGNPTGAFTSWSTNWIWTNLLTGTLPMTLGSNGNLVVLGAVKSAGATNSNLTANSVTGTDANKAESSLTLAGGLTISGTTLTGAANYVAAGTNGIQVLTNGALYTVSYTGSGGGTVQTNIPVAAVTNAGTMAYTNSSTFTAWLANLYQPLNTFLSQYALFPTNHFAATNYADAVTNNASLSNNLSFTFTAFPTNTGSDAQVLSLTGNKTKWITSSIGGSGSGSVSNNANITTGTLTMGNDNFGRITNSPLSYIGKFNFGNKTVTNMAALELGNNSASGGGTFKIYDDIGADGGDYAKFTVNESGDLTITHGSGTNVTIQGDGQVFGKAGSSGGYFATVDQAVSNSPPKFSVMMFAGAFSTNFNSTGLGTNLVTRTRGWAICNGQNGTPNLTNQFIMGAGETSQLGETGGSATHYHLGTTDSSSDSIAEDLTGSSSVSISSHYHTFTTDPASSLPPYYALYYIMKL